MKDIKKVKNKIILILSLMIILLIYCFIMYTGVGNNNNNPNFEIIDANNLISQRLSEVIPFVSLIDSNLNTAYQAKKVTNKNISNPIFLMKAYQNTTTKSNQSFMEVLKRLYGNNIFIVQESFNLSGSINCQYDEKLLNYKCGETDYDGIIYDVSRQFTNLGINNDNYLLKENIIFYSREVGEEEIIYKVYNDYNFKEEVGEFKDTDLNQDIDTYLFNNYAKYSKKYLSNFKYSNNTYRWLSTEVDQ